jgi:hypothetical protein
MLLRGKVFSVDVPDASLNSDVYFLALSRTR